MTCKNYSIKTNAYELLRSTPHRRDGIDAHRLQRVHDFRLVGHLKNLNSKPWWIAALVSWGIALFEYLIQVPANRIGFEHMNLAQLKILQEVISLAVFVPFAIFYMGQE